MFRIAHIPVVTVARTRTHIRLFTSEVPPQDLPALYSRKPSTDNKAEKNKPTFQPQADGHLKPKTFDPESQPGANETAEDVELYDNVHPDDKPIRPPHGIKIDHENHGLSAFYRKFRQTNADGRWEWTLFETVDKEGSSRGGRSWSAHELRRKSFKDLHTLWYVLLRERNLLASQKEALRRIGVPNIPSQTDLPWKNLQCRKSMARIKHVINERRRVYEGAVERFAEDKALGKIGAVAEQEAAKEKMKVKKAFTPPTKIQGKNTTGRRQIRMRTKSRRMAALNNIDPAAPVAAPAAA